MLHSIPAALKTPFETKTPLVATGFWQSQANAEYSKK
jgi:hypothetical protein